MEKWIQPQDIKRYDNSFRADPRHILAMNAVAANGVQAAAKNAQLPGTVLSQRQIRLTAPNVSARKLFAWIETALEWICVQSREKLNLDGLELSDNYLIFYDKLEKANFFLQSIIKTCGEPLDSRIVTWLMKSPIPDGGRWDMFFELVKKYGVVPREAMPSSACSDSQEMNTVLCRKLLQDACELRSAHEEGAARQLLQEMAQEKLSDVYRILGICLGIPPETFDFQAYTKNGKQIQYRNITPQAFYQQCMVDNLDAYIMLANFPTEGKPYMRTSRVDFTGNTADGTGPSFVNAAIEELKKASAAQLEAGEPVWIACDGEKCCNQDDGLLDLEAFDYAALFDTTFTMTKADMLDYGHSKPSQAMLIYGVDLDQNGRSTRWYVKKSDKKSAYIMTDAWFDRYVYWIAAKKQYVSPELLCAYSEAPIYLPPWDPMGALLE